MTDNITPNPILYVFVRTDLPSMNPGKAQAHSAHAANCFINTAIIQSYQRPLVNSKGLCYYDIDPLVLQWKNMTSQGFGTQINLKAPWELVKQTVEFASEHPKNGISVFAELILDPTYPYYVPDEEIFNLISPDIHTAPPIKLPDGRYVCHRSEYTAAYIFGEKETLRDLVGQYPLHP